MKVQIKLLDQRLSASDLAYATTGAAGIDVRACVDKTIYIPPGRTERGECGFGSTGAQ